MDQKTEIVESESNVEESVEAFVESAEKTVEDLKIAVIDKTAAIEDLHNLILEKEEDYKKITSSLETRIAELELALQESKQAKDTLLSELSEIKEQTLLKERLTVLKENDLLRSEEEAQIKQAEKIKKLSDEEFDDYVVELSDIRKKAVRVANDSETNTVESSVSPVVDLIEKVAGKEITDETRQNLKKVLDTLNNGSEVTSDEKAEEKETATAKQQSEPSVKKLTEAFTLIALRNKKNK